MIVMCAKCNIHIPKARTYRDEENRRTYMDVFCHGEKDTMHFDDDWVQENQDFMFAIIRNLCVGEAFTDPEKEYEKVEAE